VAWVFGDGLVLDPARYELRRNGRPVPMEPQAFDVLMYLVAHRERVVSKQELMDAVWGGRFVTEAAVTSRIKQVRRALGDDGLAQRLIRTVHRRVYRFVAAA
jgi:DNA-binding winged helix-turn-helix (wHTH) protein